MGGDRVFLEVVFMCVLNVKGLCCLLQSSACVWFSVHAVCSCNPGFERNNEVISIQIIHTVQPCVFWVSVRDDVISLGRACDWIDSSADCDLWLTCFWALFTLTFLIWKQCLHILCLNHFWQQTCFLYWLYLFLCVWMVLIKMVHRNHASVPFIHTERHRTCRIHI